MALTALALTFQCVYLSDFETILICIDEMPVLLFTSFNILLLTFFLRFEISSFVVCVCDVLSKDWEKFDELLLYLK